jgi:hypothetical protein
VGGIGWCIVVNGANIEAMKAEYAIKTTPKLWEGRSTLLGPYSKEEAEKKVKTLSTKWDKREIVKIES